MNKIKVCLIIFILHVFCIVDASAGDGLVEASLSFVEKKCILREVNYSLNNFFILNGFYPEFEDFEKVIKSDVRKEADCLTSIKALNRFVGDDSLNYKYLSDKNVAIYFYVSVDVLGGLFGIELLNGDYKIVSGGDYNSWNPDKMGN